MSSKGDNSSPVRVSRLKKRRRPAKESNDDIAGICALQNLTAASAAAKQNRQRCSDARAAHSAIDGRSKENVFNGRASVSSGRSFLGEKGNEHVAEGKVGVGGLGAIALQGAESPPSYLAEEKTGENSSSRESTSPCPAINTNDSILSFMDAMEKSSLLSAIPSMLGIDLTQCNPHSSDFQQQLEQSFAYKPKCTDNENSPQRYHCSENGIYHDLVGRIDPPSNNDGVTNLCMEDHSLAFPLCRSPVPDKNLMEESQHTIFQHLNLNRETIHGMRLPLSWYQFPSPMTKSPALEPAKIYEQHVTKLPTSDYVDHRRLAKGDIEESVRSLESPSLVEKDSVNCDDNTPVANKNGKKQSTMGSKPPPPPTKYQGRLKIVSDKGATIREVFDIDQSNYVIGKLHEGDERYFFEKKTLAPPPISLMDDSDDESEDECVAVVRYKVVLKPADCSASNHLAEKSSGQLVGWISDRGRLADEPYLILREVR